jgi:parallel beta-helix repeat protein
MAALFLVVSLVSTVLCVPLGLGEYDDQFDLENNNETRRRSGNTYYVGLGQTYTKIQDAVNIANPGDTIRVYAGMYKENLVVDQSVSIIGNGSLSTTIDGGGIGDVVLVTADHVKITDFKITNSGNWQNNDAGIELNNVQKCTIENNLFYLNAQYGILLNSSRSNTIANNNATLNINDGIHLRSSSGNTIFNNNAFSNNAGISVNKLGGNTIMNNVVGSNRGSGIYLESSANNLMSNNFCNKNLDNKGIYIQESNNNILTNNTLIDDGILIDGSVSLHWNTHSIDETNTINGKPIYYLKNRTGETIPPGAGQIILAKCNEIRIENQILSGGVISILLAFSRNNIIINNTATQCDQSGIALRYSDNNYITKNNVSSNIIGIDLFESDDNNIIGNFVSNTTDGIFICCRSYSNDIQHNIINLNEKGIRIVSSTGDTITSNTCSNNTIGIMGASANSISITNNKFISNIKYGIQISNTKNASIIDNTISLNEDYGLYLNVVSNSKIYHNKFINNTNQAYDDSTNKWSGSKAKGGNYWSDWISPDDDEDGFVDKPYTIDGPGEMMDSRPLAYPPGIPLKIITQDFPIAYVGELFLINYVAQDPDTPKNKLIWTMRTNAQWLSFSSEKELSGIPEIEDFGTYWVYISVTDGNESDSTNFTLVVLTNIAPQITATNSLIAYVGEQYSVNYSAVDRDTPQINLLWSMNTNATWLSFSSNQKLSGTPSSSDVGHYWVYIEVSDGSNIDFTNFMILVKKAKDQGDNNITLPTINTISILNNSNNVQINTPEIIIVFSKSMNNESVERVLKIFPNINFSIQWKNNKTILNIIFNENLQYNRTYRISIDNGAVDQDGNNLDQSLILTFNTERKEIPKRTDIPIELIRIMSYIGVLVIILIILFSIFVIKNRRKQRELDIKKIAQIEGQSEFQAPDIIDKYPYEGVSIGNAEEYIKKLMDEAQPSQFKTPEIKMLEQARYKFEKGEISKKSYESIKNELILKGDLKDLESQFKDIEKENEYPYEKVSIGNAEEYMKNLMGEALEFEKPSQFKTPEEKMLREAEEKYRKGKISKTTYHSIKETLLKKNG